MIQDPPTPLKKLAVGALAVLLLAASVRLVNLGGIDLWEDEIYTYIGSTDLLPKLLTWQGERTYPHPPMMYIEAKLVRAVLGNSPLALRIPSVLFGTLAAGLLFIVVGQTINLRTAWVAAVLMAVHPFAIEWGRDARMYAHWLFFGTLILATAHATAIHARSDRGSALDWRWWSLGILFAALHVYVMLGITTIAAVLLWFGIIAATEWRHNRRASLVICGGTAISLMVYVSSWALCGIADILKRLSIEPSIPARPVWEILPSTLAETARELSGYTPIPAAVSIWVVAAAGLALLAYRGHWRFALLATLIGAFTFATYPTTAKYQFFAPRYATIALLPLCLGIAAVAGQIIGAADQRRRRIGTAGLGIAAIGLGTMWFYPWTEIIGKPRMETSQAVAPIAEHGHAGEALVCIPEWYVELDRYYPFVGDLKRVLGPPNTLVHVKPSSEQAVPEHWDATFDAVFNASVDGADIPPATWLFVVGPLAKHKGQTRIEGLVDLLAAYGLGQPEIDELTNLSQGASTLTVRISPEGMDHKLTTSGRSLSR